MKYRKKPVVIDAVQLWPETLCPDIQPNLLGESKNYPDCDFGGIDPADGKFKIKTLAGVAVAEVGDWIIKGVNGEFYPCKPDIFDKTYEPIIEEAGEK